MTKVKPHVLLVLLEAKPGQEQTLKETLIALIKPTLKEDGCITYNLHTSSNQSTNFMIYEIWQDKAAHAKHGDTPHMQKWHSVKNELLAKATEVTAWEEVLLS